MLRRAAFPLELIIRTLTVI